jgi:hypothetical protein
MAHDFRGFSPQLVSPLSCGEREHNGGKEWQRKFAQLMVAGQQR